MTKQAVLFTIALTFGALILVVPLNLVRYGSAFVLFWLIPGLSWALLIPRPALNRAERLLVGLGLNFAVTPITTLLIAYLPGPLSRVSLLVAILGAIALPLFLSVLVYLARGSVVSVGVGQNDFGRDVRVRTSRRAFFSTLQHRLWRDGLIWLLVAILVALGLRVVNLNYSEFQGDEAKVMVGAARSLEGDEAVLFQHKKGPAQVTLAMPGWRLVGVTNEWMARLPFAWASVLGIVAVFLFGQRLSRPHAGGIAACLLAIEGYLVGFGRIVQYQSLVFALSTLGLLCLLIYYSEGRGIMVVVGAAFFASGALAHYDALLALPAGLLLVGARLWQDRQWTWRAVMPVAVAALVGATLMGLFYIPFMRSQYVDYTSSYVSARVGGQMYNNLQSSFELSAVYNSVFLLGTMLVALAARTVAVWAGWGRAGLILSSASLVATISVWAKPELWVIGDSTLAWVPVVGLLVGALFAPNQQMGTRGVWLWLALPAVFYLFFVASPFTHVYTIFPAWALLSGMTFSDFGDLLSGRSRPALRLVGLAGIAVFVVCGFYTVLMFVDHSPEYRRTFPQFKHPLYWTPYEKMPEDGLFGFPYRAGWKVVGHLMDEGALIGGYDSNEKAKVTDYYTRQATRMDCTGPDFYVTAVNVQDEEALPWEQIEAEYQPAIVVTVNDQPKLTIHKRDISDSPEILRVEDYVNLFDLASTPSRIVRKSDQEIQLAGTEEYTPQDATIGDFVRLLGYEIDTAHAVPGGYIELRVLWQVLEPTSVDYTVFTHLYDGNVMRGQLDGQPVCNNLPTSQWQPGQYVVDPYRIPIKKDAPLGVVPLTIGMYDLVTMQRLPVSTSSEPQAGDAIHLTDVELKAP